MNEQENVIIKRALTNMLMSMIKSQDAPASSEMHLVESVVALAKILDIHNFQDPEMNEHFSYCTEVMEEINALKNNTTFTEKT